MNRLTMLWAFLLFLSIPVVAQAAVGAGEYTGNVNHVMDDGTLRMEYKGGQIRVRVEGVASGEWLSLKRAIEEQVVGRQVRVKAISWQDGYLLGRVFLDGKRLGSELLADD